ncbi:helix-turn-helix domain-containing protein [Arthrobacter sp. HLT1-21]
MERGAPVSTLFPVGDAAYTAAYVEESAMVDASELIAEGLETSGMSRADLARALGVRRGEITARLKGERNITVRNLAKTLHVMGLRLVLNAVQSETPVKPPAAVPTPWDLYFPDLRGQEWQPRSKPHNHSNTEMLASRLGALRSGRQ